MDYKQKYLKLLKDQIGGEIIDELIRDTETTQLVENHKILKKYCV